MSKSAAIIDALLTKLKAMTLSPSLDLSNPEIPYTPVAGQEYLEVQVFINETATPYVGGGKFWYLGILQVTVVYPRFAGIVSAIELADEVIDYFGKGTTIDGEGVRIKINRQPWHGSPRSEDDWLRVPISIPYNCMA